MKNKRSLILLCLGFLIILTFIYYYSASHSIFPLSKSSALELGEGKYLNFLWMVDGAFNDSRYHDSFSVNDKEMTDGHKIVNCDYGNSKKTCVIKDFENVFNNLFASNIKIDNVYGDGLSFKWYEKMNNGEYAFTNLNTCSTLRMSKKQYLEVTNIEKDKIVYKVTYEDNYDNKDNMKIARKFVLIYEDKTWKISEAYYHDLCYISYYIK